MKLLKPTCVGAIFCFSVIECAHSMSFFADENQAKNSGLVNEATLSHYENDPGSWWSNGKNYSEQRFSDLKQITAKNVSSVGLAWESDLDSERFGIEATPIVVNGVMYVSSSWGRVFAFDAKSGENLWKFDPEVPGEWLRNGCCKPVNRGVAVWNGKVFVGAYDGRLIALDGVTGKKVWEANTTDGKPYYTITGAPRVVKGKVIIGNGGADFATRGFFSAYDAESGKMVWRFYVVPDDPQKEVEHPELIIAAKTWGPGRDWSLGGGGNPWDSFSYDPELDLLYVGTGNAGPFGEWNPAGGDGLFLASILAIKPDTGRMIWYYQTTPGESWDFTATQHMILADLEMAGKTRKVLMQAPKNGFFYVLDRETGELLSAKNYVRVNWADGVDLKTGRPNITDHGNFSDKKPKLVFPSPYGGHNWNPMAFNPKTGLVYIPARDIGWVWGGDSPNWFYNGYDLSALSDEDVRKQTSGILLAWNPLTQQPAWVVNQKTITNGGVLTTAGNLVVQGTEDGYIRFYTADFGKLVHEIFVGTGVVAPPISYAIDGEQYIAVAVGWNGVFTERGENKVSSRFANAGRVVVLKLAGQNVLVADRSPIPEFYAGNMKQSVDKVVKGYRLYHQYCGVCHGSVGEPSVYPDLRRISQSTYDAFPAIVLGEMLKDKGMANFSDVLSWPDAEAIRAYLVDWAQRSRRGDFNTIPPGVSDLPSARVMKTTPGL